MGAKVDRASRSLADAAELVKELQSELDDRLEKVAKLKAEYDKYEQLATLAEDKAGAIIKQFRETVDNGRSRERWIALGISLVAGIIVFVLGAVLGPPLLKWLGIGA